MRVVGFNIIVHVGVMVDVCHFVAVFMSAVYGFIFLVLCEVQKIEYLMGACFI